MEGLPARLIPERVVAHAPRAVDDQDHLGADDRHVDGFGADLLGLVVDRLDRVVVAAAGANQRDGQGAKDGEDGELVWTDRHGGLAKQVVRQLMNGGLEGVVRAEGGAGCDVAMATFVGGGGELATGWARQRCWHP